MRGTTGKKGHMSTHQTPQKGRGTTRGYAPRRGTTPTGQKPSHSKAFRRRTPSPAPLPPLISGGAWGMTSSDSRSGHDRGRKGARGTTCAHHYVRIGPYLKCSRCGDLKAAPTEEEQ